MNNLQKITSYGLMSVESQVFIPKNYDSISDLFHYAKKNNVKICPIGSGLSFSNVALINKHISLDLTRLNQILDLDIENKTITVQGGTKVTDILKLILPLNFTLVALTGSYGNTVAGNISNNVNGKDSWKNGNFSSNVCEMKVMISSGEQIIVSREINRDIFNAIIGGLGLIAIILEVKLKLVAIPSYQVISETIKCKNLHEQLKEFESLVHLNDDFGYAWTDANAKPKNYGRGLFEKANFIESNHSKSINWDSYLTQKKSIAGIKTELFWKIIRSVYTPKIHEVASTIKYKKPIICSSKTMIFPEYQYPMTKYLPQWNLLFYPKGFRELQMLFSIENFEIAYFETLSYCKKNNIVPYICALRKHKNQEGYLSFAKNGYSFTINYGINNLSENQLNKITRELVNICLKHNGLIYLGKFPFLDTNEYQAMYPLHNSFLDIKNKTDNSSILWSEAATLLLS